MSRPRSVPEAEALDQALQLFWERGFDRTSIADLGEAIGVGPSSIYNAFGSKAELFRRSLDHYLQTHAAFIPGVLAGVQEHGVEESVRDLLQRAIKLYTSKGLPRGCAILQGGGSGGSDDSEGGLIAREFRQGIEQALRQLFGGAPPTDELALPPKILAKYVLGVMRGLSQLAADGTRRSDLVKIADHTAASCVVLG